MATSHNSFRDNIAALSDIAIIHIAALMQIADSEHENCSASLTNYFSYLNSTVTHSGVGCISMEFEEYLRDNASRAEFVSLLDDVSKMVASLPNDAIILMLSDFSHYDAMPNLYNSDNILYTAKQMTDILI